MNNKMMNAAVLHAVGDLRYETVPMPEVGEDEVLLKIRACGVCGSDIPRVYTKGTYHFPTIPGHEFAGEIVASNDPALLGRRAAVFPLLPCHKCPPCKVGEFANCHNYDYYGSRRDGAFAEYLAVKKANLILAPDTLSYDCAAMCEPGAVARAAVRRMNVELGDLVVIYGAGPIGLIAAQPFSRCFPATSAPPARSVNSPTATTMTITAPAATVPSPSISLSRRQI